MPWKAAEVVLLGIDVGGTFTDFVLLNPAAGTFKTFKRPTSPQDQSVAIADGIVKLGADVSGIEHIVHGTTAATNAIIERNGARAALVTNRGFRDVLEFGRRDRPEPYGLGERFVPLIQRADRFEISGRLDAQGQVLEEVDPDEIATLVQVLTDGGYESIGVCMLHSYVNPVHENDVAERLRQEIPGAFVVSSAQVYPEQGEFERSSTTAISAFVGPLMRSYLGNLGTRMEDLGLENEYLVVRSNGSCARYQAVIASPATTLKSGPAAGVVGALVLAASEGISEVITLDMGGTSADIAIGSKGRVGTRLDNSIGFRLPVQVPMYDINTIGAGGGSIAAIDQGGVLSVGPRSAGAVPGPVCYGQGGTEPTVSDANVVLGYLPTFAVVKSGLPALDRDAAVDAIESEIAKPLRLDVPSAAGAIREVVNETMAGQIRLATIDHGRDPSSFWLVPFGGGGGLHACAMVRKLSLKGALVPVVPGLLSAFGCIMLDARHDCSTSVRAPLDEVPPAELRRMLDAHRAEGEQVLKSQRFEVSKMAHEATFSVRFAGQFHTVDLVTRDLADLSFERLEGDFKARYEELYGSLLETRAYLVAVRSSVFARIRPEGEISSLASSSLETVFDGERTTPVYVDGLQMTVPVWDRAALAPERQLHGPGVIVQPDSTIWLEPDFRASVMESGVIKLELVGSEEAT